MTIGLCSIERMVFNYRTPTNDTRLEPYSSLFLPGWRECGAYLMGKQVVLLMHDIYMGLEFQVEDDKDCYTPLKDKCEAI